MRNLQERVQAARLALAEHLDATLERGSGSRDVHLAFKGRAVALEVAVIDRQMAASPGMLPPRLRFDRVVLGFWDRLQGSLNDEIPRGVTVALTVTAPLRQSSKTATVVEEKIRTLLSKRTASKQLTQTVQGNRIRIAVMSGASSSTSRLLIFVHNRDSDPTILFKLTRTLIQRSRASARVRRTSEGDRWLLIAVEDERSWLRTYLQVCAQLFAQAAFQRILLVGPDGAVSTVTD